MDLSIFTKPDPTGKMSREKFIIKNYPEEYDYIIDFCNLNKLDIPFKQKVYHATNNIYNIVLCRNPNCKNPVRYKNSTLGYYEYCSNRCIGNDPKVIESKKQKSLEKYGTETPAESKIVRDKIIKTNNKKYGGNSPMSNKFIQYKSKETLIKNYGVDNPSKSEEILNRRIETFKKSDYKETYKKTSLEKYGVDHPWMDKEIHKKGDIETKLKKEENLTKIIVNRLKGDKLISIDFEKRIIKAMCQFGHEYEIYRGLSYHRSTQKTILCTSCNPISRGVSGLEIQLLNYLQEVYKGEILSNARILNGKEIDMYLPELKIGFEFNGLWWHSEENKPVNYHINKYNDAKNIGIDLIFIWEDEWVYNQDIIKSIINNRLGIISNKIYARKCEIKNVIPSECRKFLENNHIQGYVSSRYKYGLYYKGELVSLMTFGELRIPMGFRKEDGVYEMVRFCSKLGINVIGGAQKLFKYFLKNINPKKVISYSEISKFTGNLYSKLGFKFNSISSPNYYWVLDNIRNHRYNYRKDILVKRGYDKEKTEVRIMTEDVGAFRVWDCGQKKWEYTNM